MDGLEKAITTLIDKNQGFVYQRDCLEHTPLHLFAACCLKQACKILLDNYALPQLKTREGDTVLRFAIVNYDEKLCTEDDLRATIEVLKACGAILAEEDREHIEDRYEELSDKTKELIATCYKHNEGKKPPSPMEIITEQIPLHPGLSS